MHVYVVRICSPSADGGQHDSHKALAALKIFSIISYLEKKLQKYSLTSSYRLLLLKIYTKIFYEKTTKIFTYQFILTALNDMSHSARCIHLEG